MKTDFDKGHGRYFQSMRRRFRMRNIKEDFTGKELRQKKLRTKGICPVCKTNVGVDNLTKDHNPPMSKVRKGFVYNLNDIGFLCRSCNSSKSEQINKPLWRYKNNLTKLRELVKDDDIYYNVIQIAEELKYKGNLLQMQGENRTLCKWIAQKIYLT